jgi:hypothetical protein
MINGKYVREFKGEMKEVILSFDNDSRVLTVDYQDGFKGWAVLNGNYVKTSDKLILEIDKFTKITFYKAEQALCPHCFSYMESDSSKDFEMCHTCELEFEKEV